MPKDFIVIANAALGAGLSGSDRIFIELARRWKNNIRMRICVWEQGYEMCLRQKLDGVTYEKWFLYKFKNLPFLLSYFLRILTGVYYACTLKLENNKNTYVYAASDFWQDFLPALILKLRYKKITLITSFYLVAPNPFKGYRKEYEKKLQLPKIKDFLFYFAQLPVKFLIPYISNYIFVTSLPDKDYFINKGFDANKIVIITGGVRLDLYKKLPTEKKLYEAIFYGRFHPQKGVIEILDIWKNVCNYFPNAKLIMVGDGPLMPAVKKRITELKLSKNVTLKGYMIDSPEKLSLFSQCKIVVHPAVFDSGGMAAAEIMALKIPAVSFDLEALKTYYPLGMIKVPCFELLQFSEEILKLLKNKTHYNETAKQAYNCVLQNFDWDQRAKQILNQLAYES